MTEINLIRRGNVCRRTEKPFTEGSIYPDGYLSRKCFFDFYGGDIVSGHLTEEDLRDISEGIERESCEGLYNSISS